MQMFLYPGGPERNYAVKFFRFNSRVKRSRIAALFTGSAQGVFLGGFFDPSAHARQSAVRRY
eukprot:1797106-Amphidinium_carterae.2